MATAILDVDLKSLPSSITGLERYNRALVLVRWHGQPIAKTYLEVQAGQIRGAELRTAALQASGWNLGEQWLHHYLDWDELGPKGFTPPRATVAVCTRDRPEDLQRCIDALMRLPDDGQEVLVIDNCPATDATCNIVKHYDRVRYIREDRPGSSAARNRAIREAQHEIIAFTDDDATPDPGWLRALLRNFEHPRVLCVTGQVMPLELENDAQEWFENYSPLGRGFKRLVFDGTQCDRFRVAPIGVSANMAIRRSVLDYPGPFDEILGVGTPTRCGEDHELFSRILASGYQIVYDPSALSWHRHRRTWEDMRKTLYGYGVGVYAFWTRTLLMEGELRTLQLPWGWFFGQQLPNLIDSLLKKPGSTPIDLLLAELRGCLAGPSAYFISRQQARMKQEAP